MSQTKYLKCSCSECGGRIEYPADAAGSTIECPHCHAQTDLTVDVGDESGDESLPRRGWIAWALLGLFLLGAAGAAAPYLLKKRLERSRRRP